jgi:hypothetical protein
MLLGEGAGHVNPSSAVFEQLVKQGLLPAHLVRPLCDWNRLGNLGAHTDSTANWGDSVAAVDCVVAVLSDEQLLALIGNYRPSSQPLSSSAAEAGFRPVEPIIFLGVYQCVQNL